MPGRHYATGHVNKELIAFVQISATDPVAIYPLQLFVFIRAIRGQKYFVEDKCLEGTTERSDSNRGRSPREEAIALILPGRQYACGGE